MAVVINEMEVDTEPAPAPRTQSAEATQAQKPHEDPIDVALLLDDLDVRARRIWAH